jgi:hypothetical protein
MKSLRDYIKIVESAEQLDELFGLSKKERETKTAKKEAQAALQKVEEVLNAPYDRNHAQEVDSVCNNVLGKFEYFGFEGILSAADYLDSKLGVRLSPFYNGTGLETPGRYKVEGHEGGWPQKPVSFNTLYGAVYFSGVDPSKAKRLAFHDGAKFAWTARVGNGHQLWIKYYGPLGR